MWADSASVDIRKAARRRDAIRSESWPFAFCTCEEQKSKALPCSDQCMMKRFDGRWLPSTRRTAVRHPPSLPAKLGWWTAVEHGSRAESGVKEMDLDGWVRRIFRRIPPMWVADGRLHHPGSPSARLAPMTWKLCARLVLGITSRCCVLQAACCPFTTR